MTNTCRYWLHRISHEWDVSYKLLDDGFLTIGWSSLINTDIIECIGDPIDTELFESIMKNKGYGDCRTRWGLWYFFSFKVGDIVVVPLSDGKFSIFRVKQRATSISDIPIMGTFDSESGEDITRREDGRLVRNGQDVVDLGFAIRVEPIKERLSRFEYADSKLTSRMKIRQVNSDITSLSESVEDAIKAREPLNLYNSVMNELSERLQATLHKSLNPNKFEMLIKWYFKKLGANSFITAKNEPGKHDGADADVIAVFDKLGIVYYIQVKFHNEITDEWAVKQIASYKEQKGEDAFGITGITWVVSTADDFSDNAKTLARETNTRLVNGSDFSRMLLDVGITDINEAFV